jgi:hypothetical protein
MSCQQNVGKDHKKRIVDELFEFVAVFRYLGTTLTDENRFHAEIRVY